MAVLEKFTTKLLELAPEWNDTELICNTTLTLATLVCLYFFNWVCSASLLMICQVTLQKDSLDKVKPSLAKFIKVAESTASDSKDAKLLQVIKEVVHLFS